MAALRVQALCQSVAQCHEYFAAPSNLDQDCTNVEPVSQDSADVVVQSLQTKNAALFLMKLESFHLVPSSVVHIITTEIHSMNSLSYDHRLHVIGQLLNEHKVDNKPSDKILSPLSNEPAPFNPVSGVQRNKYAQHDFYQKEFKMIEPVRMYEAFIMCQLRSLWLRCFQMS